MQIFVKHVQTISGKIRNLRYSVLLKKGNKMAEGKDGRLFFKWFLIPFEQKNHVNRVFKKI